MKTLTSPIWESPHSISRKTYQLMGVNLEFCVHQSPLAFPTRTPRPPPSAGGFTNEAKVNPGGLRAVDKQHRVPLSEVFTPERAHICAVSLLHTKASHLNLTPDLWVRLKIRSSHFSDQEAEAQRGSALEHRAGGEARLEHRSPVMTLTPLSSCSLES